MRQPVSSGHTVRAPGSLRSASLFSFDSRANSRRQFLIMSFSGFAVTGLAVALVYTVLPEGELATRVARGVVLFLTALTVVLEFPLVVICRTALRYWLPIAAPNVSQTAVGSPSPT